MVKIASFQTDAAAVAGFGAHTQSGLTFLREQRAIRILDITAVAGAVRANDADWTIWVDNKSTGMEFVAEAIDPAAVGRNRLLSPITIHPGAIVQFAWAGQAAAQANVLTVQYDLV